MSIAVTAPNNSISMISIALNPALERTNASPWECSNFLDGVAQRNSCASVRRYIADGTSTTNSICEYVGLDWNNNMIRRQASLIALIHSNIGCFDISSEKLGIEQRCRQTIFS